MKLVSSSAMIFGAFSALITPTFAATVVPHRVAYDLLLEKTAQLADVAVNMKGRMVYEFLGDACEGYTVNFRFVLETGDGQGNSAITDLRTNNFESADGRSFDFKSQTFTNEVQTEDLKGSAVREGDGINVKLKLTEDQEFRIDKPVIFPTAQLIKTIEEAKKGTTVFSDDVYDGTDGGQHLFHTSTVIGAERKTPPSDSEKGIGDLRRWPVTVSYFTADVGGDQPPDYSISFDLWENGVSSKMRLDYGDFVLDGDIVHFELLPPSPCDTGKPADKVEAPKVEVPGMSAPDAATPTETPAAPATPETDKPVDVTPAQPEDAKPDVTPSTPAKPE